jgi:hypothetical protein
MHRSGGIWLAGVAGVGKTRMALEAVRQALPNYTLIPLNQKVLPDDLGLQPGERIVFWLDDILARGTTEMEALALIGLVQGATARLKGHTPPLFVVTCTKAESALVRIRYRSLLQGTALQEVLASSPQDAQWTAFLQWADTQHLTSDRKQFDGTPGSLILDLEVRVEAFHRLDPAAQALLQLLSVCFGCNIGQWTGQRLQHYAAIATGLDHDAWLRGITALLADRWLIQQGNKFLIPVDAYLTLVLPRGIHARNTRLAGQAASPYRMV